MKKILTILIFALASTTLTAQTRYRGIALGADIDTVKFIVASPFDNWFVHVGGGIQTFIGNELESSARHNKLNFNGQLEIGKWIIPDIAVSLRYSLFNVDGQTQYNLNPFVDFTGVPTDAEGNLEYQPFNACAMAFLGFVTIDWTNLFNGYETGKRTKIHWRTGVGLGMSMLFGSQINPNSGEYEIGDFRRNLELAFAFNVGIEYSLTEFSAIYTRLELFGSESTWDWSPYDNSYSIFDIIPSFSAGARFNLLSHVHKYNPHTQVANRDTVYHEFQPVTTTNTVKTLNGKIEHLKAERDNMLNDYQQRNIGDSLVIDSINRELEHLQNILNNYDDIPHHNYRRPNSLIDELLDINQALGLPYTVVYFELDKYNLDYNARKNLQEFARVARNLPDTIEFYMIGAADSLTGSILHNQWLSERRCEAAYNMLTENYGLSGNQLTQVYAGGINDYTPQENNRMVLVIQRTPVTDEIVERWLRMSRERMDQQNNRQRRR